MAADNNKGKFVKSSQGAAVLNGIHTDVVCYDFDDRAFIVATQLQKFGTLVQVTKDIVLEDRQSSTFSTKVLLGVDEPLTHVIAQNLVSGISTVKPIVLAVSLKEKTPKMVKTVAELIKLNSLWSQ
ncbi:proteasome assembly chaperone 3-like [Tubulanus polymorphus]|uniref:proteasome assembly chaperone 3-like n=1 Tax=Tubulanus polymorphus TaxID=672921 RepID=UPI003DA658A9